MHTIRALLIWAYLALTTVFYTTTTTLTLTVSNLNCGYISVVFHNSSAFSSLELAMHNADHMTSLKPIRSERWRTVYVHRGRQNATLVLNPGGCKTVCAKYDNYQTTREKLLESTAGNSVQPTGRSAGNEKRHMHLSIDWSRAWWEMRAVKTEAISSTTHLHFSA